MLNWFKRSFKKIDKGQGESDFESFKQKVTYCKDLTYCFEQYVVDVASGYYGEKQKLKSREIRNDIPQLHITIADIKKNFPKELRINHIIGEHTGTYHVCDMLYSHEYDGFITGYGNERAALLFYHFERIEYVDGKYVPFITRSIEKFKYIPEINWIEFNVHRHEISKGDIDMLMELAKILQENVRQPLVVLHEHDVIDIDEVGGYLQEEIIKLKR